MLQPLERKAVYSFYVCVILICVMKNYASHDYIARISASTLYVRLLLI